MERVAETFSIKRVRKRASVHLPVTNDTEGHSAKKTKLVTDSTFGTIVQANLG